MYYLKFKVLYENLTLTMTHLCVNTRLSLKWV